MPEIRLPLSGYSGYIIHHPEGDVAYLLPATTFIATGHATQFGDYSYRTFLAFDAAEIPAGAAVESAVLKLVSTDAWYQINTQFNVVLLDCDYPDPVMDGPDWDWDSIAAMWDAAGVASVNSVLFNTTSITDVDGYPLPDVEMLSEIDAARITPGSEVRFALVSDAELASGDPGLNSIAAFPVSGQPEDPELIVTYSIPVESAEPTAAAQPRREYPNLKDVRVSILDTRTAKRRKRFDLP